MELGGALFVEPHAAVQDPFHVHAQKRPVDQGDGLRGQAKSRHPTFGVGVAFIYRGFIVMASEPRMFFGYEMPEGWFLRGYFQPSETASHSKHVIQLASFTAFFPKIPIITG